MLSRNSSVAILSLVVLVCAYWYMAERQRQETARLEMVLAALLRAESSVSVNPHARVAIGFGACLDVLSDALKVMHELRIAPPVMTRNYNEINQLEQLQQTFAYFFMHGASAGRLTSNDSLFTELMSAMTKLSDTRLTLGGNAPVMTKRLRVEGVQVMLAATLSSALRSQIDPDVIVVGDEVEKDDIHLIFEYQRDAVWGGYSATRANRFIVYNGGHTSFSPLLQSFRSELDAFDPSLLIIGGLRLMSSEPEQKGQTNAMTELVSLLSSLPSSIRVHVEMSSFPDAIQLRSVIDHAVVYADSLGMNEQELPNIRACLNYSSQHIDKNEREPEVAVSNSHPRIATTLDHMRAIFELLWTSNGDGHVEQKGKRRLSRLHVHTLAYQVIMTGKRMPGDTAPVIEWKNSAAAVAKASLTANRHTCGRHAIDINNARLLIDDSFATTMEINAERPVTRMSFDENSEPVRCWSERSVNVCIAPVLVCKTVVQTVGGGDNVSAAGLVLQI